ncbi:TolC family outer membrane protein [Pseudomonadota bacterium]
MTLSMKQILNASVARIAQVGVVGGALIVAAQGVNAETLNDALAKAYATNPTLQAARATLRATDEGMAQAVSGWRPSLTATGTTSSKRFETSANPGVTTDSNPRTMTLTLNQSIFAGGQTMAAMSSAQNTISAQRARLAGSEQTVMLNAATAFLNVLRDQAVVELNMKNEQVLTRHLEATQDRFNVGEITRTDVHQAEARLAGSNANRIQAEGTLAASRANYANLIGEAPTQLDQPAINFDLPQTLGAALDIAEKGNPALVSAIYDEKAAQDSVSSTKGQLLPTLDLTGSANRSYDTTTSYNRSDSLEAKLTLTVPLYQSGTVYSQLRQARQQASALRLSVDQARRDTIEQVRQAWQNLTTTRARIESIETQVRAAQTALEGVEREASVGSRTVLDVLDSEQELLDARVNLVTSQRDKTVAELTLLSALGNLTAQGMNLAVDLYDTDRHYRDVRNKWFGSVDGGAAGQ